MPFHVPPHSVRLRRPRGFLALLCAALLGGVAEPGDSSPVPPTWEAYDAAVARTWEAKFAGNFEEALRESRRALGILLQLPDAPAYKIHGTQADVRIQEEITALSPEAQSEIHSADEMSRPIRSALRRMEHAKAESLAAAQLAIRVRHLGPRAYDVAESQRFVAQCLAQETRWSEADSLYLVATGIYTDYLGPKHPNLATTLADRAANAQGAGRRGDAEELLSEGITLLQEQGWENHPLYPIYAYSLTNLSVILKGQGELARAETAARRALALLDGQTAPPGRVAAAQSALGQALYEQGRHEEATGPLVAALELSAERSGWNDPDVARARINVAANLRTLSRWDEAEAHYRAALAVRDSLYGVESEFSARARLSLASLLDARGRPGEAEALFTLALNTLGDEPTALRTWGDFLRRHQRFDEAEATHRKALAEYRRHEDPRFSRELSGHLRALATDLYAQDRLDEARDLLEEASTHFEAARLAAGDRFERATFETSPYPLLAATYLSLGDSVRAWEAEERSLGRAFLDILASGERRVPPEVGRERKRLLGRLEEAETRWSLLQPSTGAVEETSAGGSKIRREGDPTGVSAVGEVEIRHALLAAQSAWTEFQETQRRQYPFPGEQSLGLEELRAELASGDAVVGWFDLEIEGLPPRSWAYVVRADHVHWFSHPASGDREEWSRSQSSLRELREQLHGQIWNALGPDDDEMEQLRTVSRDRWQIAMPALRSADRIVVIGTGALDGVPVEALLAGTGEPVVDRWTITTAPSTSIHVWLGKRSRSPHRKPRSLFAVADPSLEASPFEDLPWRSGAVPEPMLRGGSANGGLRQNWTPVPASRDEVRAITPFFARSEVVVGDDASEAQLTSRLENGTLHEFDVVHFATHAFADDRSPDRSALVLSQVGLTSPPERLWSGPSFDGFLTAREIRGGWNLDAELVVLSACESALGAHIRGEGFVGLTQSFLLAGSRNVLASLWAVDDEATRRLMDGFYRRWLVDGESGPEALRTAKRELRDLEVDGRHPYAHPRYWAAFVWVGPGD